MSAPMRIVYLGRSVTPTEPLTPASPTDAHPWPWLAGGALLFFLVPLIGTDMLGLQPDLYYLLYFTVAIGWFAAFAYIHAGVLRELWTHNLGRSLVVGVAAGLAVAGMILDQAGTDHPDGWRYGFEILWRGVVYGTVDALTLFVFPAAVAYLLMHRDRTGTKRKIGFAVLALILSMLVTATYHLGYSEYRDQTMRYPAIGALVANVPTALTGNPLGAVVTHGTMHVTAVVHQRNGGDAHMLPPRVTADYASHGDSDLAAGLAAGWLVLTAGALTLLTRRLSHAGTVGKSKRPAERRRRIEPG